MKCLRPLERPGLPFFEAELGPQVTAGIAARFSMLDLLGRPLPYLPEAFRRRAGEQQLGALPKDDDDGRGDSC